MIHPDEHNYSIIILLLFSRSPPYFYSVAIRHAELILYHRIASFFPRKGLRRTRLPPDVHKMQHCACLIVVMYGFWVYISRAYIFRPLILFSRRLRSCRASPDAAASKVVVGSLKVIMQGLYKTLRFCWILLTAGKSIFARQK
jgi:hypothetical protein